MVTKFLKRWLERAGLFLPTVQTIEPPLLPGAPIGVSQAGATQEVVACPRRIEYIEGPHASETLGKDDHTPGVCWCLPETQPAGHGRWFVIHNVFDN